MVNTFHSWTNVLLSSSILEYEWSETFWTKNERLTLKPSSMVLTILINDQLFTLLVNFLCFFETFLNRLTACFSELRVNSVQKKKFRGHFSHLNPPLFYGQHFSLLNKCFAIIINFGVRGLWNIPFSRKSFKGV